LSSPYHVTSLVLDSVPNAGKQQSHTGTSCDGDPGDEAEEVSIVEVPHTIVDPGAMVIHLEDTFLADPTVMRSRWLEGFAVLAVSRQGSLFLLGSGCSMGDGGSVADVAGSIPYF